MWLFLALGLLAAYVANILRMVVIVLVGYYTDTTATDLQNMLVAHSYAGWLIFLAWMALFWGLLLRFLPLEKKAAQKEESGSTPAKERVTEPRRSTCAICGDVLTPAISATRCRCGAYVHQPCLKTTMRCPMCGRSRSAMVASAPEST
jgi:exosortase/archaeosortase family protein